MVYLRLIALWLLCMLMALWPVTSHALPLSAIRSMVVLQPSASDSQCIAVHIANDRLILSSSCRVTSTMAAIFVQDVYVGPRGQLALTAQAPIELTVANDSKPVDWDDSITKVVDMASYTGSIIDHAHDHSPMPLHMVNVTYPGYLSIDPNTSIVEIDLDTLTVAVIDQVIYVDKSLCKPSLADLPTQAPRKQASSVCVLPLTMDDRASPPKSRRARFLVKHDVASDRHMLLGLGIEQEEESGDGFRLFSWLATNFLDASFAESLGRDPQSVQSDRVLGPPVPQIDLTNQFIAGIRATKEGSSFCTGSLVASRYVLTAAHCASQPLNWVSIGSIQKSGGEGELIRVSRMVPHPKYNSLRSYDVLLIELAVASSRKPIRLVAVASEAAEYKTAMVLGYGQYAANKEAESVVLRSVDVPLAPSNDVCSKKLRAKIDASMICAGGEANRDACYGDSGGPLVVDAGTAKQRLLATVAFGRGCGSAGTYKVYTRLSAVVEFIKANMKMASSATADGSVVRERPMVLR